MPETQLYYKAPTDTPIEISTYCENSSQIADIKTGSQSHFIVLS